MHEQHIEMEEEEDENADDEEEDDEGDQDNVTVVRENEELDFLNNHQNINSQPEQQLLNTMTPSSNTDQQKKRKLSVTEGTITAYVDVDEYQESHPFHTKVHKQSEDDLFCSGVACSLKKLSRLHNIKAKVEIYKVLEKFVTLEEKV